MVAKPAKDALRACCLAAAALLLLAQGCQVVPSPEPPPATTTQTSAPAPAPVGPSIWRGNAGTTRLVIDAQQSSVVIIVRRAGPLARLGHDHVITSTEETGSVWLGQTPADTVFEVQLPVEQFEVDRPEARAAAGPEFANPVPEEARVGTRRNMLRTEVLDASRYPFITLRSSRAASGEWAQAIVPIAIELHGVTREQEIPFVVERTAGRLVARGELRLNQSDYGITPFAVGGGAIQVADTLEVRFEIVATAP